jgi:DNA-binding GntR family transcriptional regulator
VAGARRTAPVDAYEALRDDIAGGRLLPNERLVEHDLARRYGVSRGAVRTALVRLEQDRVIVHEPNRGARVRIVSEAEAVEILEARAALEGIAAAHAARHATDEQLAQLREIAAEMAQLHEHGDLLDMSEANARLHALILQASGHQTVQLLAARLNSQMVRFQYRTILVAGRARHSLAEHREIVEATCARDSEAAERAMRAHLSNVARALHERVMALADQRPDRTRAVG